MKHLLLPAILLGLGTLAAGARGTTLISGTDTFNVDTTFHAKVGPGTTQTSLLLTGPARLTVFYLTIDQTTPGVSIRTLNGGSGKLAGNTATSVLAQRNSHDGLHYFCGSNGDFYYTGGQATNGSSQVGTPTNALTVDREVLRTSNGSYQFSVDVDGIARICRLNYQKGTATCGGTTVAFKAINNSAPNNGITLYTDKFWGSSNQTSLADNCSEVTAKLVEGDNFWAGCSYRLEVTSDEATHTGDRTVPDGEFVILGRGNANDFVNNLKKGDIVTFDNITMTPEGEKIVPSCVVSGNPKNVGNGVNLNSEAERGDASSRHPRTGIGISADGSKIVMMVVDGRSAASVGCTTGTLGDILIFAGCAEGVNLDGGGSSTLYTEALGVRNHCSDGKERSTANSVYAVLEAPEDNNVAELTFMDYNPTLPHLGLYTPQIIAFNKYGLAINTDFKDFQLSCDPELGEIVNDGKTLYVTGSGLHALTVSYGDVKASVPVYIDNASSAELKSPSVVIDETHPYTIGLTSTVGTTTIDLNPAALSWAATDASIATVNADGIVTAVSNDTTSVIGTLGDIHLEQTIIVENHSSVIAPLADFSQFDSWKVTKSDVKDANITCDGQAINMDFTIKITRGPKVIIKPNALTYGIPEAFDFDIDPINTKIKSFNVSMLPANSNAAVTASFENLTTEPQQLRVKLSDYFDTADLTTFPITLQQVQVNFGNDAGDVCQMKIKSINQNYDIAAGVSDVVVDSTDGLQVTVSNGVATLASEADEITLTDLAGRVLAKGSGSSIALPAGHGIVVLSADGQSAKVAY